MLMTQSAASVSASAAETDVQAMSGVSGALDDAIEKMLDQADFHEELALQVRFLSFLPTHYNSVSDHRM